MGRVMADASRVYGLQIANPGHVQLVKKVMTLACIAATIGIGFGIFKLFLGQVAVYEGLIAVGLALCIPACGWFGAKNNDKTLMCLFCGCHGLNAALMCCAMIMQIILFSGAKAISSAYTSDDCVKAMQDANKTAVDICSNFETQKLCLPEAIVDIKDCCECTKSVMNAAVPFLAFTIVLGLPSFFLSLASFVFGKQLHDELTRGQVVVAPPAQIPLARRSIQP